MKYDVMVAGHLCLDIIPEIPDSGTTDLLKVMSPGKLVHVEKPKLSTGGAVSNTGIAMRKLGNSVCFCARIGDDDFGRLTLDCLSSNGGVEGISRASDSHSSYSVVIAPPGIDRIFLHSPGANDFFGAEDVPDHLLAECSHFHFGYPPLMRRMFENDGDELVRLFEKAKRAGVSTSCDMALPDPESPAGKANWRVILQRLLPSVDIFLPSVEEAYYALDPHAFLRLKKQHGNTDLIQVLGDDDYRRISDELIGMGTKMTALKAGARGWYFRTGDADVLKNSEPQGRGGAPNWRNRELWSPALHADEIKSATGAGDCSIAGFLTAFLKGMDIEFALRAASCLGWQNLRALDALSAVEEWSRTLWMLDQAMPIDDPNLSSHWTWSDEHRVFRGGNDHNCPS